MTYSVIGLIMLIVGFYLLWTPAISIELIKALPYINDNNYFIIHIVLQIIGTILMVSAFIMIEIANL
ncbi:hypothetical protein PBI_SCTP2_313 [Salicola phage SCTP-2]|nr:hypothetical protein PBI_SCTP2_313 [Salicola phage SCTP-2]